MADLTPPRRGEFLTKEGQPTHRFMAWIESLTVNSNTNTGNIENADIAEKYPWPTAPLAEETESFVYPTLQPILNAFNAVTVTSNYTVVSFDFVNVTRSSTITLPKYPNENDVIIVRNGEGVLIRLHGNGKNINGSTTGSIRQKGTAITFQYFIESDEWFAR